MTNTSKSNVAIILLVIVAAVVSIIVAIDSVGPQAIETFDPQFSPTATFPVFDATLIQPSVCYNGPGEYYRVATIAPANLKVNVLGKNSDSQDWLMVQENSIGRCWIKVDTVGHSNNFDGIITIVTAFTMSETICYIGPDKSYGTKTHIPTDLRIVINGKKDTEAEWVLITPHDSTEQCWVTSYLLTAFDSQNIPPVPFFESMIEVSPSPVPTPPVPTEVEITWKILSYDCYNGRATGALVDLNVAGGVPPYTYSTELPLYGIPGQYVSITVYSNTLDREPKKTISFTLPNASDRSAFQCESTNNSRPTTIVNTPVPPSPVPPSPVPTTPKPPTKIPPTPTLCWPPGHCK